jgi:hypothetical protein
MSDPANSGLIGKELASHHEVPAVKAQQPEDPSRTRTLGVVAAVLAVPVVYLLFVAHFSMNMPYEDDWTVVPLIHAALHGHLSFGQLWMLHDENRMLFPNLMFIFLGVATHDDTRWLMIIGALIFVATYLLLLAVVRSYLSRPMTPLVILVLGLVWFSLVDWQNAIWAFQFAWYLILFCLLIMIYFLCVSNRRTLGLTLALVAAIVASFSFFQGIALWPAGLICLLWTLPGDSRKWSRRKKNELLVWLGAAIVTVSAAVWGYNARTLGCGTGSSVSFNCGGGSTTFAQHHPLKVVEFGLVEIGEVIPNAQAGTLWLSGLLGAVLLSTSLIVLVLSYRRRQSERNCAPVALIVFSLIFVASVAIARAPFLAALAPSSIYTMPSLLIVVAIIIYAWGHWRLELMRTRRVALTLTVIGVSVLLAQVTLSAHTGIVDARAFDERQTIGARLVVNLDKIPPPERGCYAFYGEFVYLIFGPSVSHYPAFTEAQKDHLTVFSPGLFEKYRGEGLPHIAPCHP